RFVSTHGSELRVMAMEMGGATRPPQSPPSTLGAATGPQSSPSASRPTTEAGVAFRRTIHETIAKATQDIERDFHFNTAISAVMELVNALYAFEAASHDGMPAAERAALLREAVETTLLLLGPIAPHLTEELWSQLGHTESLFTRPWPEADPRALVKNEVTLVVQVDGKVRSRLQVAVGTPAEQIERLALEDARVQAFLTNGRLQVVRPADADAILDGEVMSYGVGAIAFDKTLNVQQYRLLVVLNLRMRDVRRNSVLFQQANVAEQADFRVAGPVSATIAQEETALTQAAGEIARSTVSLALDRF